MRVIGNWATALPHVAYVLLLTHLLLIVVSHVKAAPDPPRGEAESRYESFASTRWSIVIEAGNSATVSAHAFNALSELCQIYWRPLYSFLRRQGCGAEDARDRLGLEPVAWTARHYFLSDDGPRAIIPSATAKRRADNSGRFSASAGAVCANSDANCGGLGAGGGGTGCRLTTIGSRAMSPRTKATAATIKAAVVVPYSDVSQKNKARKARSPRSGKTPRRRGRRRLGPQCV